MAAPRRMASMIVDRIFEKGNLESVLSKLKPRTPENQPLPPRISGQHKYSTEALGHRREVLKQQGIDISKLANEPANFNPEDLQGNIENFIGFAKIPVGVIGPLRINGAHTQGDFYVPLATTEGALVASYNRGCYAAGLSGGVTVACLTESVSRAPCFIFNNLIEASQFVAWAVTQFDLFQKIVAQSSSHAKLLDIRTTIIGKEVYLNFEYSTGDASGQNMVTLATAAICSQIVEQSPVKPQQWYIEGNLSGDKKATMMSFGYVRGKKVVAEVKLGKEVITKVLRTTAMNMQRYWEISFMGGSQSGAIGSQGHFANALAALFIACGQDVACVSEASVGLTRMQAFDNGELYVAVTLPNLIVGTVGGGTRFETARECLEMIDCYGLDKARKFAEICASVVLAGEISIIAALTAGDFAKAHGTLGRNKKG